MDREEGGVAVMGRAEIDTRAPFKSVREAVMLFGERVLAGEIYANKLKEIIKTESDTRSSAKARVEAELEETKLSLMKAKEEGNLMAYRIKSLREELEHTKKELNQLKTAQNYQDKQWAVAAAAPPPRAQDPEIEEEDLKFIETAPAKFNNVNDDNDEEEEEEQSELEKKRYVKFASPPSLTKVMVAREDMMRQRSASSPRGASYGKKGLPAAAARRRSVGPVLGWLFNKKKGGGGGGPRPGADFGGNEVYDRQSPRY